MIRTTLTMIPGPTPVHADILTELARPTLSHQDPRFTAAYRSCLERLKQVVRGEASTCLVVGGAGTLAMEMALVNALGAGDRLLVVSHGFFGDRYAQMAEAFGIEHDLLDCEWGGRVPTDALREKLTSGDFAALAFTHVDTSSGVCAPVSEWSALAREHGALVILDGVCATAGVDERFDEWGVDFLLTGAQKALGAPPGVGILFVSERGLARRTELGSVRAYYADIERWLPVMDNPALYFSTPPVNEIRALDVAAGLVLDEGLDARFARHERLAAAARAGFAAMGLELFTEAGCRADTLSVVLHPAGLDDEAFRGAMAERGVVVAGALGPVKGRACRVGHMGNIGPGEIARMLDAYEASLRACGRSIEPGAALAAAAPRLER